MFGKCRLEIFSLSGDRVGDLEMPSASKREIVYPFSRDSLAAGIYVYRIRNNGSILYEGKIIIR